MARKMLVDGEIDKATADEANYDFDLFVIGAGSGGVRAARFSANHGAKVSFLLWDPFLIMQICICISRLVLWFALVLLIHFDYIAIWNRYIFVYHCVPFDSCVFGVVPTVILILSCSGSMF